MLNKKDLLKRQVFFIQKFSKYANIHGAMNIIH